MTTERTSRAQQERTQADHDDHLDLDEVKGRVKQAAGDLTDDEELEREGTVDRVVSDVKTGVDRVADRVKDLLQSRH